MFFVPLLSNVFFRQTKFMGQEMIVSSLCHKLGMKIQCHKIRLCGLAISYIVGIRI